MSREFIDENGIKRRIINEFPINNPEYVTTATEDSRANKRYKIFKIINTTNGRKYIGKNLSRDIINIENNLNKPIERIDFER